LNLLKVGVAAQQAGEGSGGSVGEHYDRVDPATAAFRAHQGTIYRYLLRRTRSADDAEELTQQVFADAAPALTIFRPGTTPVLALLYTLARRRVADAARRQGGRRLSSTPIDELADQLPEREQDQRLGAALHGALARLPPDLATVATMKLVQGASFAEIASCVGVSEVACRKRLQRALEQLRSLLKLEGLEP
jgi:RNA polymerase sigma factor (sigma-70 family)